MSEFPHSVFKGGNNLYYVRNERQTLQSPRILKQTRYMIVTPKGNHQTLFLSTKACDANELKIAADKFCSDSMLLSEMFYPTKSHVLSRNIKSTHSTASVIDELNKLKSTITNFTQTDMRRVEDYAIKHKQTIKKERDILDSIKMYSDIEDSKLISNSCSYEFISGHLKEDALMETAAIDNHIDLAHFKACQGNWIQNAYRVFKGLSLDDIYIEYIEAKANVKRQIEALVEVHRAA